MNIIFLDIDGVMIPYGVNAVDRRFDPIRVEIINKLCKKRQAFIVTNSAHNYNGMSYPDKYLREDLISYGIKEEYMYPGQWHTEFGKYDYENLYNDDGYKTYYDRPAYFSYNTHGNYLTEIYNWIRDEKKLDPDQDFNWVCFNDMQMDFVGPDRWRLVHCNMIKGLTWDKYKIALNILGRETNERTTE